VSLRKLVEAMAAEGEVGWIEPEEWSAVAAAEALADVDTPDDLRRLLERP
jgi:CTP:molybdopterin cytidylyltransferase MocA